MSDVIKFEFDQPVEVALQYADSKVFPSNFPGGDDRHMFSTSDGRVMYHSPLTAAKIKALGVQVGERFFIVKRKNGRLTDYAVFREGAEPPAAAQPRIERMPPAERARRLPELVAARNAERGQATQPEAPSDLEKKLADSIALVQAKKTMQRAETAVETPGWVNTLISQTNWLVDAYAQSLTHASKHGQVRPEDVRSLLVTSFIQLSQKAARNAA